MQPLIGLAERPGTSARNLSEHFGVGVSGVCIAFSQWALGSTRKLWFEHVLLRQQGNWKDNKQEEKELFSAQVQPLQFIWYYYFLKAAITYHETDF